MTGRALNLTACNVTSLETGCRVTLTVTGEAGSRASQDTDGRGLLTPQAGRLAERAWPESARSPRKRNGRPDGALGSVSKKEGARHQNVVSSNLFVNINPLYDKTSGYI